mmetsp:Transcript_10237/g.21021  ORF Transcript_10237/g.21021 Transcript_10237/m.21021 type:complete len:200 (+) Transcript_10237:158-757(+)|eukprot:CAMPEP_0118661572 /NCGR_PEP_ID=MMETSP0785-20121206/16355_1 /TAXON_ID=91992 /ORGANISM="Bolidomonas pacifica, Strain CCMP 1866" /LENGTH=199 /DNA_ID=CAMNT_0006555029 /DNA_START=101 /DNA_END=700 /DNA_ORIENTATION=+
MPLRSPFSSPKTNSRKVESPSSSDASLAYGNSDSYGGSEFSRVPSTLDSNMYEEVGPHSMASTGTEGSDGPKIIERKDKDGNVIVNEKGVPIKWRVKRRAGHRKKKRRASLTDPEKQKEVADSFNDLNADHVGEDEFDSRMGDADDRVNDVDHLLTTGEDVDYHDDEYVTNYVIVKKKKSIFRKLCVCFGGRKKKKMKF